MTPSQPHLPVFTHMCSPLPLNWIKPVTCFNQQHVSKSDTVVLGLNFKETQKHPFWLLGVLKHYVRSLATLLQRPHGKKPHREVMSKGRGPETTWKERKKPAQLSQLSLALIMQS